MMSSWAWEWAALGPMSDGAPISRRNGNGKTERDLLQLYYIPNNIVCNVNGRGYYV